MLNKNADSAAAYFFFAFIAMVGTSYINFLPGVVSALAGGIGFTDVEAGEVVAFNGYGALLGSIAAIFLVRRIYWKPAMFMFLLLLTMVDTATVWVSDYSVMLGWRLLAGLFGGLCMGIAFSVLARLNNPDRAFGALLFIQFSVGAIVMYLLPEFEAWLSAYAVFYVMAGFGLLSLTFLFLLPALSQDGKPSQQSLLLAEGRGNALLLMLAIIFYNCAASAIWAYVEIMGLGAGMDDENVSTYIASTSLLGLLGAILPMSSGSRFGRFYWVILGVTLSIFAAAMLSFSPLTPFIYVSAMALLFFSWTAVLSYLLAVTAELDTSGRLSTIASVVALLGSASGPLIAAALLDDGNFSGMLYACAIMFLMSILLLFKPVKAQEKEAGIALSAQC
ncbi:MFS transporter [Thalassomonas viridans]|uniref:MFS transporter n=1 Tax=Thalassomonas viridans TaxID=137584 RepID=A0AAE9ZA59_9GAMM|nr:MFS transporter [Thalassomonas viridans]WDE08844.1 MFS transporter [Thalassomonas viridans]